MKHSKITYATVAAFQVGVPMKRGNTEVTVEVDRRRLWVDGYVVAAINLSEKHGEVWVQLPENASQAQINRLGGVYGVKEVSRLKGYEDEGKFYSLNNCPWDGGAQLIESW